MIEFLIDRFVLSENSHAHAAEYDWESAAEHWAVMCELSEIIETFTGYAIL